MTTGSGLATPQFTGKTGYCVASLTAIATIYFLGLLTLLHHPSMIAPEPALHLEAAKLIAAGKVPYRDFFCLSSPLLLYGSLIPLLLAQVLHCAPSFIFNVIAWLACLASTLACAKILLPRTHHREWHCFPPFLLGLTLTNVILLFQLGLSEHIFIILIMPYLLIRWLRCNGYSISKREAIVSGVFGGIAIALNYLFAVFLIVLEGLWLSTSLNVRSLIAPEVGAGLITVLAYDLFLILSPDPFTAAYLATAAPLFASTTDFYDMCMYGFGSVPDRRDIFYAGSAAVLLALLFRRSSMSLMLIVMFWAGFWFYLDQPSGMTHTAIPMIATATLLWMVNLGTVGAALHRLKIWRGQRRQLTRVRANFGLLYSSIALFLIGSIVVLNVLQLRINGTLPTITDDTPGERPIPADSASWVAKYSEKGDEILFLTDDLLPAYPLLLQMDRKPSGYCLEASFMPLLNPEHQLKQDPKKNSLLAEKFYSRINEDIENHKPKMIFVHDGAMHDLLASHKITNTIEKYYVYKGGARLKKFEDTNLEPLEYHGNQYNLTVYTPRDTTK
ncbi:MAG: hypothetical protein WC714_26950 [Candidatus Obscuribacterales bacterium]|jgi:hypothetical protein